HGVRAGVQAGTQVLPHPVEATPVPLRAEGLHFTEDQLLGVLNGVVGDHLRARGNPLDMGMQLRFGDRYFEPAQASSILPPSTGAKVAVFVHGLMATEGFWAIGAEGAWGAPDENYATKLAQDLGYLPLFVRYNTGVHISDNGRALSEQLAGLAAGYPALEELVLIGHSLGGLVARSATHHAGEAPWLKRLRTIITLGTPHEGSPIAEGGQLLTAGLGALDTPATQVLAKIGRRRSAAMKDLRRGYLTPEDGPGRDVDAWLAAPQTEVPFIEGVAYLFLGSSTTKDPSAPLGRVVGDLLVRESSATHRTASFDIDRRMVGGLHHLNLQADPGIYAQLRDFLG
ncbi:MAG: hypothetical protein AAFU79_16605, partial [Myxococcota bacterium]